MTTKDKATRRKLSLLELAQEMSNVSRACRIMGYSRQQFYEIRRNYQTYGAEGLIDRLPGARGPHPNRVCPRRSRPPSSPIPSIVPATAPCGSPRSCPSRACRSPPEGSAACGPVTSCLTKQERLLEA